MLHRSSEDPKTTSIFLTYSNPSASVHSCKRHFRHPYQGKPASCLCMKKSTTSSCSPLSGFRSSGFPFVWLSCSSSHGDSDAGYACDGDTMVLVRTCQSCGICGTAITFRHYSCSAMFTHLCRIAVQLHQTSMVRWLEAQCMEQSQVRCHGSLIWGSGSCKLRHQILPQVHWFLPFTPWNLDFKISKNHIDTSKDSPNRFKRLCHGVSADVHLMRCQTGCSEPKMPRIRKVLVRHIPKVFWNFKRKRMLRQRPRNFEDCFTSSFLVSCPEPKFEKHVWLQRLDDWREKTI